MVEGRESRIVNVRLFASVKDAARTSVAQIKFEDGLQMTAANLRKNILELYPQLDVTQTVFVLAVNHRVVKDETLTTINPEDEVAALPPISGG